MAIIRVDHIPDQARVFNNRTMRTDRFFVLNNILESSCLLSFYDKRVWPTTVAKYPEFRI